jgi:hypothetical protein
MLNDVLLGVTYHPQALTKIGAIITKKSVLLTSYIKCKHMTFMINNPVDS